MATITTQITTTTTASTLRVGAFAYAEVEETGPLVCIRILNLFGYIAYRGLRRVPLRLI